jgi:hypothetical protein
LSRSIRTTWLNTWIKPTESANWIKKDSYLKPLKKIEP